MSDTRPSSDAPLSRRQTLRIAHLARLDLTEAQADLYAAQLSRVLEYVEQLRSLDLGSAEPMLHPHDQSAVPVPDEPARALESSVVLSLAPRSQGPFIRVPRVLGEPGGGGSA